jgi:hypothetical protein
MFRFRPSFESLESRETPSDVGLVDPLGQPIDPTTGLPVQTTTTTPTDPTVDPSLLISH